jgi:hypothetical protein
LPGRTPPEAREAFLAPLRRSLSCITDAQLFVAPKLPGQVEALALSADPLLVRSAPLGDIQFVLGHQYRIIEDDLYGWRVSTAAYRYDLLDGSGKELIAWHWHPDGSSSMVKPHLHMSGGPVPKKAHVPTGRVTIESVLRLLLTDLEVSPRRTDFHDVLDVSEGPHLQYRSWS